MGNGCIKEHPLRTQFACCKNGKCIGDTTGEGELGKISPVACTFVYGGNVIVGKCGDVDCCDVTNHYGACCPDENAVGEVCEMMTFLDCRAANKIFMGNDVDCNEITCCQAEDGVEPIVGACCKDDLCSDTTVELCGEIGGTWRGETTRCADDPDPCEAPPEPPTGACCSYLLDCTIELEIDCVGTYIGDYSTCNNNPCSSETGACCYSDFGGFCEDDINLYDCTFNGGSGWHAGTLCVDADCEQGPEPPTENGCCYHPATGDLIEDISYDECITTFVNGLWLGENIDCPDCGWSFRPGLHSGDCCINDPNTEENINCLSNVSMVECLTHFGYFAGRDEYGLNICAGDRCRPDKLGGCCFKDANGAHRCIENVPRAHCELWCHGHWGGSGTLCTGDSCGFAGEFETLQGACCNCDGDGDCGDFPGGLHDCHGPGCGHPHSTFFVGDPCGMQGELCDQVGGGCCHPPMGLCYNYSLEHECIAVGGSFLGYGVDCPVGGQCDTGEDDQACCLGGTCYDITPTECYLIGGTGFSDDYWCNQHVGECTIGARYCCKNVEPGDTPVCFESEDLNCTHDDGTPGGEILYSCDHAAYGGNPCEWVRCCQTDELCWSAYRANCIDHGGEGSINDCLLGDKCDGGPIPTGACCIGTDCHPLETEVDCHAGGGIYLGDSTTCLGDPCKGTGKPLGACCISGGGCTILSEDSCDQLIGINWYSGNGTICDWPACGNVCRQPRTDQCFELQDADTCYEFCTGPASSCTNIACLASPISLPGSQGCNCCYEWEGMPVSILLLKEENEEYTSSYENPEIKNPFKLTRSIDNGQLPDCCSHHVGNYNSWLPADFPEEWKEVIPLYYSSNIHNLEDTSDPTNPIHFLPENPTFCDILPAFCMHIQNPNGEERSPIKSAGGYHNGDPRNWIFMCGSCSDCDCDTSDCSTIKPEDKNRQGFLCDYNTECNDTDSNVYDFVPKLSRNKINDCSSCGKVGIGGTKYGGGDRLPDQFESFGGHLISGPYGGFGCLEECSNLSSSDEARWCFTDPISKKKLRPCANPCGTPIPFFMPSTSQLTTKDYFPNGYPGVNNCDNGTSCNPFGDMIDGFTRVLCYGDKTLIETNLELNYVAPNLIKPQPKCCGHNNATGKCESITDRYDFDGKRILCNRIDVDKNPGQNPLWVHRCCQDLGNPDEVGDLPCNKIEEPNCQTNTGHPCCQYPPSTNCYNDANMCCDCRCSDGENCNNAPIICSNMDIIGKDIPCKGCKSCCSSNTAPTYHGDLFTDPCCRKRNDTCDEDSNCCNESRNNTLGIGLNNGCYNDEGNTNCKSKNRIDTKRTSTKVHSFKMKNVLILDDCVLVRCGNNDMNDPCVKYRGC